MQFIKLSESTAARRRVYFTAVSEDDFRNRITGMDDGEFTGKVSKNGAAAATDAGTFVEIDAGDSPGLYYYEFTAGEVDTLGMVTITITGTESGSAQVMEPRELAVQIVAIDIFDTVRLGLTALPNAAAEASGGLYTRGTGAGQINQPANGQVDVNLHRWLTATPSALISGRVDATVGAMQTDVLTNTALAASATGEIADAVWDEARAGHISTGSFGEGVNVYDYSPAAPALDYLGGATAAHFRTVDAVSDSTHIDFSGAGTTDGFYVGFFVYVYVGTGFGQVRRITAWDADGGGINIGRATITPAWSPNPDTASLISVLAPQASFTGTVDANVVSMAASTITSSALAASALAALADAVWDEVMEGAKTARQWMRGFKSALWGKAAFTGTTRSFRDDADTKNRINANISSAGRTTVTEDLT